MDKRLEFDAIVCGEMKKKTTKEWTEIFENREIWYSPVNEYDDVLENEQIKHNQSILTMKHPVAGEVRVVGHANKYDKKTIGIRKMPPELGEDTESLLASAGYTDKEIGNLFEEGVIFTNPRQSYVRLNPRFIIFNGPIR